MNLANAARAVKPYIAGNLYFSLGVSAVSGLSNSLTSFIRHDAGLAEGALDFFHAFGGNFGLGLIVNFIPATFNQKFKDTSYFWLTGNLMMLGMNALMLGLHIVIRTENPIEARILPTVASQILQNILIVRQIRRESTVAGPSV
ncbi:MAG: hypothetical protein QF554_11600 [Dehalococcoidia bacterium]|nr:hypothetical protein [Dehalococcoidia bacterium]